MRAGFAAGLLLLGFGAGYVVNGGPPSGRTSTETERQTGRTHRRTSPFLECLGEINADQGLVRFRAAAVDLIDRAQAQDTSLRVSVYARDLNNGPWVGINESATVFTPASLWKVPLMMFTLARAEDDPALLDRKLTFRGPETMRREDSMLGRPREFLMVPGESYSYRDLLFRMIAYSDNFAEELLLTGVSTDDVDRLLAALNAEDTYVQGRPYVAARTYASLFRVLYNSTFFSRPMSELALHQLVSADFREGIRKHLPAGVEVASKYGLSKSNVSGSPVTEFHECGIVYHPRGAYTLCIMTKSRVASPERLAELVALLSKTIWETKAQPAT